MIKDGASAYKTRLPPRGLLGCRKRAITLTRGRCLAALRSLCRPHPLAALHAALATKGSRRSGTLATCTADHSPPRRAVGMSCSFSPAAMARRVVAPAACSAAIVGARSPRPWLRRAHRASPPTVCACVRSGWSRGCLRVSCRDALRRPVRRWSSRKSCRPRAQPPGPATMSLGDGALGVCAITGIVMARLKLGTLGGRARSPPRQSPPVCPATFRNRLELGARLPSCDRASPMARAWKRLGATGTARDAIGTGQGPHPMPCNPKIVQFDAIR